jgi:hypothetical protein
MSIDNILLALNERLAKLRNYKLQADGSGNGDIASRASTLIKSGRKVIGRQPLCASKSYIFTDIAIKGPGSQFDLAQRWGLKLPPDYLQFCEKFAEYLFAGRISIHLWDAPQIEEYTHSLRLGHDFPTEAPHLLFQFAAPVGLPSFFAMRWDSNRNFKDVVYCWDYGDVGEAELLGDEGGGFCSDTSFAAWLTRMIESDGSPLFPREKTPTSVGHIIQALPPLIRVGA